jgi:hypothetical protein
LANDDRALLHEQETHTFSHSYNNMQLPLTMVPSEYGDILLESHDGENSKYAVNQDGRTYVIESDGICNDVQIPKPTDLKWTDTKLSDNTFRRNIMKDALYVRDGQVIVKEKQLNAKAFKVEKLDKVLNNNNNFMAIDIETILVDNKQVPYLICGYSKGKYIYSVATDSSEEAVSLMFNNFISKLLSKRFENVKYIYAHNFSGFDGILILKHLLDFVGADVKPLLYNNKLISINFKSKDRTLVFKDSLLLLPVALRNLCRAFEVKTMKTHFPFNMTDINYVGKFPSFDKWTELTQEEYDVLRLQHGNRPWSFQIEAIKYCKLDCKALFEVLTIFNELVYSEFKVNIHSSLTLPALAMRIYKSSFMVKDTLFQMLGNVEWSIRESYTGGAVDVYQTNNHPQCSQIRLFLTKSKNSIG